MKGDSYMKFGLKWSLKWLSKRDFSYEVQKAFWCSLGDFRCGNICDGMRWMHTWCLSCAYGQMWHMMQSLTKRVLLVFLTKLKSDVWILKPIMHRPQNWILTWNGWAERVHARNLDLMFEMRFLLVWLLFEVLCSMQYLICDVQVLALLWLRGWRKMSKNLTKRVYK